MENLAATIESCQTGNKEAFAELYEYSVTSVYKYHLYRTGHRETAEDLTSQTFIKVLDNFASFNKRKASYKTWLYTIARNTLYDYRSEERRCRERV